MNRRAFLAAAAAAAVLPGRSLLPAAAPREPRYGISLAEWSLHRALRSGALSHLDFPARARVFGIDAVEYVSSFFPAGGTAGEREKYLAELARRCADAGVSSLLIMCDGEGALGDADETLRQRAVDNHRKWLDAAVALGCHSIRVNAAGAGAKEELARQAAGGLHRLCELADPLGLNVIVENHGGWSSDAAWLAGVIRAADHPRAGTLPDFGNFRISADESYDPYRGVAELMPFARGVSAKSYDFDPATGEETTLDFRRLLAIVTEAGYRGRIGIEYEGSRLSEDDGIRATLALLERYRFDT